MQMLIAPLKIQRWFKFSNALCPRAQDLEVKSICIDFYEIWREIGFCNDAIECADLNALHTLIFLMWRKLAAAILQIYSIVTIATLAYESIIEEKMCPPPPVLADLP